MYQLKYMISKTEVEQLFQKFLLLSVTYHIRIISLTKHGCPHYK